MNRMVWLSKTAQQGVDTAFITGIANLGDEGLVILLSLEAVLSSGENEEFADISADLLIAG